MNAKFNKNNWVKGKLRQASIRYPARNEALRLARKQPGKYECAGCVMLFPIKKVHVDHIYPVIDIKNGWTDWNDFITRLFCDVSGFQILCTVCHAAKTSQEDTMRAFYADLRRKAAKELAAAPKPPKIATNRPRSTSRRRGIPHPRRQTRRDVRKAWRTA